MMHNPEDWQSEHARERAEVGRTIKSGECTIEEWITALESA